MNKEFEKIVGYESIKRELDQICDILSNPEKYRLLGVKTPSGLVLHGKPGLGKTLMAKCLIKGSGRKAYTCRKDLPNGEFVKKIKTTFDEAIANAPSIVFLDDMDKFANGDEDYPDSEEYVTVQSCMDHAKGKDVFVLATANRLRNLPRSLLRCGRFDREIRVTAPSREDSGQIIRHYLKTKPVDKDIDIDLITRIMNGCSCAELESVLDEAGLCAAYKNCTVIRMEHFLEACLPIVFDAPGNTFRKKRPSLAATMQDTNREETLVAYHEAGHIVVAEALDPGIVTVASVYTQNDKNSGFTAYCRETSTLVSARRIKEIVCTLGGIAAVEQRFGTRSVGGAQDLDIAFTMMKELVVNHGLFGIEYYSDCDESNELKTKQEYRTIHEMDHLYQKTKKILASNMELLDAVAMALVEKGVITANDIDGLKKAHPLNSAIL